MIPTYKIIKTVDGGKTFYSVVKPCGEVVNNAKFKTLVEAKKKHATLKAFGYCK